MDTISDMYIQNEEQRNLQVISIWNFLINSQFIHLQNRLFQSLEMGILLNFVVPRIVNLTQGH